MLDTVSKNLVSDPLFFNAIAAVARWQRFSASAANASCVPYPCGRAVFFNPIPLASAKLMSKSLRWGCRDMLIMSVDTHTRVGWRSANRSLAVCRGAAWGASARAPGVLIFPFPCSVGYRHSTFHLTGTEGPKYKALAKLWQALASLSPSRANPIGSLLGYPNSCVLLARVWKSQASGQIRLSFSPYLRIVAYLRVTEHDEIELRFETDAHDPLPTTSYPLPTPTFRTAPHLQLGRLWRAAAATA
jgi:hypothetical protein